MTNLLIEEPLSGGRNTQGVVRVGSRVHKPIGKNHELVIKILVFLQEQKFPYSPLYYGVDEQGRAIYEFIEGFVPPDLGGTTHEQLYEFMGMVRKLHDCSFEMTRCKEMVICHQDLSPCNVVFVNHHPIAIIDWDQVTIGEAWQEVTYIIWLWLNIGGLNGSDKERVVPIINQALFSYGADENMKRNFAKKMILRMDKLLSDQLYPVNDFNKIEKWVIESKNNVIQLVDEITKLIG